MSNYTWPESAICVSNVEDLALIHNSNRAIVFLTVEWSGPERKSRECFRQLVELLGDVAIPSVDLFVIDEDNDAIRRLLPNNVGCSCVPLGAGTMFWMEHGKVMAGEVNPGSVGRQRLFERTVGLWASFEAEEGAK